uniref:Uncharacterized protein n=1 Tax=Oncorhynchus kisutch TaxID=8019 RepID=A0A8C7KIB1_ONCKI
MKIMSRVSQFNGCENGVDCSVEPLINGQEEMSPELQCCVEWLWAYFSELWTVGRLPLPFFHHPTLHGGLSVAMDKYLQSHDWDQAFTHNCQLHHLHSTAHCVIIKYFMAESEQKRQRENRTGSCNLAE